MSPSIVSGSSDGEGDGSSLYACKDGSSPELFRSLSKENADESWFVKTDSGITPALN